jgi:hypothetical protein
MKENILASRVARFPALISTRRARCLLDTALFLFGFSHPALADSCRVAKPHAPTPAQDAYLHGNFPEAETLFRQALTDNPSDAAIVVGLVESLLRQQKVTDAATAIKSALTAAPKSAVLLTTLAEVQYRQGLIVESGESATVAYNADICYPRVHLIRARLARLNSMYATERKEIISAHALDPGDPDIQSAWIETLPLNQRISELKKYLNGSEGLDEKQHQDLERYLDHLEMIGAEPQHRCRLVSGVNSTKLSLENILGEQLRTRSWALMAKLNDADAKLELDSGSSGFYISSKIAAKAGLRSQQRNEVYGLGDRGPQGGYSAYAASIRVGNLEFRDCLVDVSDRKYVGNADGLVGTDIFEDFLVSIDFPRHSLELSPLPVRLGEPAPPASLRTEMQAPNPQTDESPEAKANSESQPIDPKVIGPAAKQGATGPKDRYIAPEMQSWYPVFRSGHDLIVFGLIDKNASKLFLVDTGSEAMILSEDAATEIRRIYESPERRIFGLNGEVRRVYSGGVFTIRFADQNVSTREAAVMDLSRISNGAGVEISGLIGLPALKLMTIHIDYRDGLVKFDYDPTVVPDDR